MKSKTIIKVYKIRVEIYGIRSRMQIKLGFYEIVYMNFCKANDKSNMIFAFY